MPDRSQTNAIDGYRALALILWAERGLIVAVFLIATLSGLILALQLDKTYTARSSLLVRYDDAYVYTPLLGAAGAGESFSLEQIIQSEIGLLRADALKTRVLNGLGLRAVYPELADDYVEAGPAERREIFGAAVRRVRANLGAGAAPNTSIIDVSFTHEDPEVASLFLNALIPEYLEYRRDVLLGAQPLEFDERRAEFEARLESANAELEAFLSDIGVGDFESARQALREREARVSNDLLQAEADLAQWRARLSSIRGDLTALPREIEQYVENDASGRLLELELERQELLTRYTPDSTPVREIEQQIAGVRRFLAQGGGEGAGLRRVGPNPVRQALETDRLSAEAQVSALSQRVSALRSQHDDLRAEQLRLQKLAPEYERLARSVRAVQGTLDQLAERQEQSRATRELAAGAADNVRIVERAEPPTEGQSLKKLAFAAVLAVAGFLALAAGLVRAFFTPSPRGPNPGAAGAAAARPRWRPNPPSDAPPDARKLPVLAMVRRARA